MSGLDRVVADVRYALADADRRLTEAAHADHDGQCPRTALWDALNYCEVAGAHLRRGLALVDARARQEARS